MGDQPIDDIPASVDDLMADTSAAAEQAAAAESRTFRGRSMEELIPRIREQLGADAIVVRSGERLTGGFLGFFQKRFVEVEARAPLPHELPRGELPRNDLATADGLATPGIKALIDQAQPFAAQLVTAQVAAAERTAGGVVSATSAPALPSDAPPAAVGLYGPQPNLAALRAASAAVSPETNGHLAASAGLEASAAGLAAPPPAALASPVPEPLPATAQPSSAASARPIESPVAASFATAGTAKAEEARRIQARMIESGLVAELAEDLVGEAVDHFLPFATARPLEVHVRTVIARRLAVLSDLGPGSRTLAFVGAGGSGKTSAAANLAVAYAAAGRRVTAIALGDEADGRRLAARLEPLGIAVHVAGTGERASELIARTRPDLTVVDVCESSDPAGLETLRSDLSELDADEVHLALPATLSPTAATEEHTRQRVLGVTHICVTHADATAHPGGPVGLALHRELPVSYLCTRANTEPADAGDLAARLLP